MKDRFKRRIWHKPECNCGACPDGEGTMQYPPEGPILDPVVFDLAGRIYFVEGEDLVEDTASTLRTPLPDTLIPMDSTGSEDKNGKLIYEGDVLQNHKGERVEVIWYEKNARWSIRKGKYPKPLYRWSRNTGVKIIGNIYENPNILANEK